MMISLTPNTLEYLNSNKHTFPSKTASTGTELKARYRWLLLCISNVVSETRWAIWQICSVLVVKMLRPERQENVSKHKNDKMWLEIVSMVLMASRMQTTNWEHKKGKLAQLGWRFRREDIPVHLEVRNYIGTREMMRKNKIMAWNLMS